MPIDGSFFSGLASNPTFQIGAAVSKGAQFGDAVNTGTQAAQQAQKLGDEQAQKNAARNFFSKHGGLTKDNMDAFLREYTAAGGDPLNGMQLAKASMDLQDAGIPDIIKESRAINALPDTDPAKATGLDYLKKKTTITDMFNRPIAGVDPVSGLPRFGTINDGLLPPGAAATNEKNDRANENAAMKYAKDVGDSGIPDLIKPIEAIAKTLSAIPEGGNIPGVGGIAGALPDWAYFGGKDGEALRQNVATVRNVILKARSGGAVTPGEADRMLQELGTGLGRNDSQFRRGFGNVVTTLGEKLKNFQAGYRPEGIALYKEQGGNATADRFDNLVPAQDVAAPAGGSAPVMVRTPQERDALPSGTQYTAPDGKIKVKP